MLQELDVENYAVAEKLRIRFHAGLNLLTGETGSGKSIVVDALSLLLGARASADVIRAGSPRARVAGIFEVTMTPALAELLDGSGLQAEQGELIVEREVLDNGKSRAYVNGRAVTLGFLRDLAPALGDIHGQHEQQDLFLNSTQLAMLDAFAGAGGAVEAIGEVYRRWRLAEKRLAELRGNEQERLRLLDLYRFQAREIEEAKLDAAEEQQLEQQRRILNNLSRVQQAAATAYDALYDSSVSAAAQVKNARRALEELERVDASVQPLLESLQTARAQIEDASLTMRAYLDRLEPDPERLERIEDRLALIEKLKRKYGVTLEAVLAHGREAAQKADDLESSDRTIAQLEKEQQAAADEYEALAAKLSRQRQAAAKKLETQVQKELASLAMPKASFEIAFQPVEAGTAGWTASGADRVAFLISANPGQPPRPLAQVASGGELSRITLALKSCLLTPSAKGRNAPSPRTLVFDEIDSGVGGRVAEALGQRLKALSESHQVLCVTHLPQVAGFADAHYFVEKREGGQQTFAEITELSPAQRVDELARMISGAKVTDAAVEHARQMLKTTRRKAG